MSKCEHGLTSAECYVCASPMYGKYADDLAVSAGEVLACLQFLRTHLYAAQAQATDGDDSIIMRHVYDAYKRVSDVCKEVELHGIAHPAAPAPAFDVEEAMKGKA